MLALRISACVGALALTAPALGGNPQGRALVDTELCSSSLGTSEERIVACTRIIESRGRSSTDVGRAFNNRGTDWLHKGEYEQAIADFSRALDLEPDNPFTYGNRGDAWRAKGDNDRAIADFDQAIRLHPKYAKAYLNRGNAWLAKNEPERAIHDYDQAIRLEPQFALAFLNRGVAWKAKGEHVRAISDYDQAIRLEPGDASAYNNLAWLIATSPDAKLRNGKRAVELARKACDRASWRTAVYLGTLAAAYAEAGEFDLAVQWQEKGLEFADYAREYGAGARERLTLYRAHRAFHEQ